METNEKGQKAQHSTGKHPEPSEDVQANIETVTPDTENPGQEEVNKNETKDNGNSELDQEVGQDDVQTDDKDNKKGGDERDDIETVSP